MEVMEVMVECGGMACGGNGGGVEVMVVKVYIGLSHCYVDG